MTKDYEIGKVPTYRVAEANPVPYSSGRKGDEPAMSTISSKNQITLPVHLLREIGIGAGDRLAVTREGNRLVLRARPKDWVKYHGGSLSGVYGGNKEAADDYLRELRDDGGRTEEIEEAWDGQRPAPEK